MLGINTLSQPESPRGSVQI